MAELAEVEAGSCPGCGWHQSIIDSDDHVFGAVDHVCPVCANRAQWDRVLAKGDEAEREAKKKHAPATPHAADGRYTRMTILSPEEVQRRGGASGNTH